MARKQVDPSTFLAGLPMFKGLGPATLARLGAAAGRRVLSRGEVVFHQGEPAECMYVVVYGQVKLVARTPVRGARLTGIVGPGRSFAEPVMFLERPTLVEARAATDTLLLQLPKEAIFAELERDPRFARRIIGALCGRIEGLVEELDRRSQGSGRERFVAYLLREGRGQPDPLVLTLAAPKAEIASQLNLTPEHFSRILRELADAGLLQVQRRRITVPDTGRLKAAAARPA